MLHLITGTNGAGKTLHALKWVMERATKENRPVAHNGRFKPKPGGPLDGWKQIDFKDWQAEPDGTIFLIDECHNDLPTRPSSAAVPEHIKMLAEHRRRGFDFYFISQHPGNIDSFVRKIVGSPGWHRHIKRLWGQDFVSILEWDAVNLNCEKANSSHKDGTSSQSRFPKEVYNWYESATIHTNKRKVPKMLIVFIVAVLVAAVMAFIAYKRVTAGTDMKNHIPTAPADSGATTGQIIGGPANKHVTTDEYLELRRPRVPGFPHTAPAYDDVTKPVVAPFPAACVQNASKCHCFTQQATRLHISEDICKQIVKDGYFVDWAADGNRPQQVHQQQVHQQQAQQPLQQPQKQVSYSPPPAYQQAPELVGFEERMAERNASVVSTLKR